MNSDIPKVIHYCWFGGKELPKSAKKCIASWKKHFPDYEIKRWDETNFDVNIIPYTKEAYKAGKFAFVSDYARFWILYNYGGLYFDTDVEVIKPFDEILKEGAFMGCELPYRPEEIPENFHIAPGLGMAAEPYNDFYKRVLDFYVGLDFIMPDNSLNLTPVGMHITKLFCEYGLENKPGIQNVAGINIYPVDYFCPKSIDGKLNLTRNSVSIHHFDSTWLPRKKKLAIRFGYKYPKIMRTILILKHLIDGTRPL